MSTPSQPKPGIPQALLDDRLSLPGLLPQEIVIFRAWWQANQQSYTSADFNVRVGTGIDPGAAYDAAVRKSSVMSTQKRIDALLGDGRISTIIEVKYRATPLVIGQIICYQILWQRDNPSQPAPLCIILCAYTDADTRYCCNKLGLGLQVVQADFSGIKVQKQ